MLLFCTKNLRAVAVNVGSAEDTLCSQKATTAAAAVGYIKF
jgi:hypothetical protein